MTIIANEPSHRHITVSDFPPFRHRDVGKPFGLEWAERYHYRRPIPSRLDDYI